MLTDKIHLLRTTDEADGPEDLFGESLGALFPDDITNLHGDFGHSVVYRSPIHGDIVLELADPNGDDSRKLNSHFLWNSSLQLSELIEEAQREDKWDVRGKRVLELGAGTGLAGIVATKSGALEVCIADYPAPEVLANIRKNVEKNIPECQRIPKDRRYPQCWVQGHEWGALDDKDPFVQQNKEAFDILLVADCLWMPWQHASLQNSIAHFMRPDAKVWVVAGFHTGRASMAKFFFTDRLAEHGLELESIVERDPDGNERPWVFDRGNEDITERKRWLAIAVLRRRVA
jgi:predicted nicotinamide N-methyase